MKGLQRLRVAGFGILGIVFLVACWDAYAAFGPTDGVKVGDTLVLPRATELAMPHSWEMVQRMLEPLRTGSEETVLAAVWTASLFTLKISAQGWVLGVVVGLVLAVAMARLKVAEQALLPWIVMSQTVPLIAIAPLVRRWGTQLQFGSFEWTNEHSVALIASYLAFFAVAVGALRGFKSPPTTQLELMQAYGVGWWRTFLTIRLPASVPYLLPALRLAAASAVIGSVVAEVSIGLRGGIGRMVVDYAQSASSDPAKAWAPIFGAVAVGLLAAGAVGLIRLVLRHYKLTGAPA